MCVAFELTQKIVKKEFCKTKKSAIEKKTNFGSKHRHYKIEISDLWQLFQRTENSKNLHEIERLSLTGESESIT